MKRVTGTLAALMGIVASAAAAQPARAGPAPELPGVVFASPPRSLEDFTLTDQDGRSLAFSTLHGAPALIFFGFTHCPDVCPTTLFSLRQVKDRASRELANLRLVLISVDGDRDSPAAMKEYLSGFRSDFIGLTGTPAAVREIAARFPAVFVKGIPATPGGDYAVQHSQLVYAVNREGKLYAQFSGATVDDMITSLRAMVAAPGAPPAAASR